MAGLKSGTTSGDKTWKGDWEGLPSLFLCEFFQNCASIQTRVSAAVALTLAASLDDGDRHRIPVSRRALARGN